MMNSPPPPHARVRRRPERAAYDRETVHRILDEALSCHVAFVRDGHPVAIPTIHARSGDILYLHGSPASGFVRDLTDGQPVCVSVSVIDGIVLARSAFIHSLNYRSVVAFGEAILVDGEEKLRALEAIVEHVAPGRWPELRPVTEPELRQTAVLRVTIQDASAKIREGGPRDPEEDQSFPVWAGVLPLALAANPPIAAANLPPGVEFPGHPLWNR